MKKLLVVDDDASILHLLEQALPILGYEADFAATGEAALQHLNTHHYDLILADISMPNINGIDVARAASREKPYIPIVFMSGNPNTIVEERSFLPKPFTLEELEIKLDMFLSQFLD
jgi:CheY-like chemotaxis protein